MPQIIKIILSTIAPIVLIASLGALLDKTKKLEIQSLSRVTIYLAAPALAFDGVARSSINSAELGQLILFSLLSTGAITLLAWLISLGLKMDRLTSSAFVLSASLINAGNYGIPFNEFAFGQSGLERAIIVATMGGLYGNTVGIFLASWGKASISQALKNVLKVPLPYATVLGLGVNLGYISLPPLIMQITHILAESAIPLMLIMLGIQISQAPLHGKWAVIIGASSMRLLGGAIAGLLFAQVLGLEGVTRQVAIIESAMPVAVFSGVLAAELNSDTELVSSAILLSTLLSPFTLPWVLLLVR